MCTWEVCRGDPRPQKILRKRPDCFLFSSPPPPLWQKTVHMYDLKYKTRLKSFHGVFKKWPPLENCHHKERIIKKTLSKHWMDIHSPNKSSNTAQKLSLNMNPLLVNTNHYLKNILHILNILFPLAMNTWMMFFIVNPICAIKTLFFLHSVTYDVSFTSVVTVKKN